MKSKMLCAWCDKFMYYLDFPSKLDSHGICDSCLRKHFPQVWKDMQKAKRSAQPQARE